PCGIRWTIPAPPCGACSRGRGCRGCRCHPVSCWSFRFSVRGRDAPGTVMGTRREQTVKDFFRIIHRPGNSSQSAGLRGHVEERTLLRLDAPLGRLDLHLDVHRNPLSDHLRRDDDGPETAEVGPAIEAGDEPSRLPDQYVALIHGDGPGPRPAVAVGIRPDPPLADLLPEQSRVTA